MKSNIKNKYVQRVVLYAVLPFVFVFISLYETVYDMFENFAEAVTTWKELRRQINSKVSDAEFYTRPR